MIEDGASEVIGIIEKVLKLSAGSVTVDSCADELEEWDSLGHLGILTTLDAFFQGKVAGIDEIATANSVKNILHILKDHDLI